MATFTFTNADNVFTGTALADIFILSDLTFFGANDTASGGAGLDTFRITATAAGSSVLDDRIASIELITITSTAAIDVDATDVLKGLVMTGNIADNSLTGTYFADTLVGGSGNDALEGWDGNDTITGGADTDTLFYTGATGATLTLTADVTGVEAVTIGTLAGVTTGLTALNVDAGAVLNGLSITGNNGANTLTGTAFDDTLLRDRNFLLPCAAQNARPRSDPGC